MTERPFEQDAAELHEALVFATSYRLVTDTPPALRPYSSARAPTPRDLSEKLLACLRDVVADVPIDVQARIRDVFWEAKRDATAARQAILDYVAAAEQLEKTTSAVDIAQRIDRAFAISRMMRVDETGIRERSIRFITDETRNTAARVLVAARLADRGVSGLVEVADVIEEIARQVVPAGIGGFDWEWSRRVWEVVAMLYAAGGNAEKRDAARFQRATTFEQQARWLRERGARAMMVADLLEKGVRELLQIGMKDAANSLRAALASAQDQQIEEMVTISSETVDLTELVHQSRERVSGISWRNAMLKLVGLVSSPSKASLRAEALRSKEQHPFLFLIGRQTLDERGRVVASEGDEDALLRRHMIEGAINCGRFATTGIIEPARRQILFEHNPSFDEWCSLLVEGTVTAERLRSWAIGFDAGFRGDWLIAMHIIFPQIENLLRELLDVRGYAITSFREEGVEISNAFGGLVRHPNLPEILPEDIIFDLESHFVDRAGLNLRNLVAHGQLADQAFHSEYCAYAWHFALRLALLPVVIRELQMQPASPPAEDAAK